MGGVPPSEQACVHLGFLRFLVATYIGTLGPGGWPVVDEAAADGAWEQDLRSLDGIGDPAD